MANKSTLKKRRQRQAQKEFLQNPENVLFYVPDYEVFEQWKAFNVFHDVPYSLYRDSQRFVMSSLRKLGNNVTKIQPSHYSVNQKLASMHVGEGNFEFESNVSWMPAVGLARADQLMEEYFGTLNPVLLETAKKLAGNVMVFIMYVPRD